MTTYLFPIPAAPETQNAMNEQLAGVPAGTWMRLSALRAQHPTGWESLEYASAMMADAECANLDCFEVCGWGQPTREFLALVREFGLSPDCGQTTDSTQVRLLLGAQNLDVSFVQPLIVGLAWS